MRVLFLDIDGVLNTGKSRDTFGKDRIDPDKAERIQAVCDDTGAVVVVSSDWRRPHIYGMEATMKDLRNAGLEAMILDATPDIPLPPGMTGLADHRAEEISMWLAAHPEVDGWAIVDDMQIRGLGGVVQTSDRHGLTEKHAKILRRHLSEPRRRAV